MNSLPPDQAEPDPDYRAVLEWVWSFSERPRTAQEIAAQRAVKLARMQAILDRLDQPQRAFPSVLVAGTKGKGSTVAMLAACLQAAGRRTGRYTSPHLVNWRERTCINAEPISTRSVIEHAARIRAAIADLPAELGPPTTFEVGTAFAFLHFASEAVEVAVIEVGVGGRLDATNLVEPRVSVITPISYDHTQTLGETLTEIAGHKAGIMRPGRPAIAAPQPTEARLVIEQTAAQLGAELEEVGREWRWQSIGPAERAIRIDSTLADVEPIEVWLGLLGQHQRDNATAAVAALHALGRREPRLRISPEAIQTGLRQVEWPGRLQIVRQAPLVVVDGAHNAASAEVVRHALEGLFTYRRLQLVVGLTAGKDARGVLDQLAPVADVVRLTRSHHERSAEPAALSALVQQVAPRVRVVVEADVATALQRAVDEAQADDLVLVTGSLFVVGEALLWSRRSPPS